MIRTLALLTAITLPATALAQGKYAIYPLSVTPASIGAVALDDPTGTIYGLGPQAVVRGEINILKVAGLSIGDGQTTAARQANATLVQAAINVANTSGLTLSCPDRDDVEINNATGLVVPTNTAGIRARLDPNCSFIQFGTNAPILTIGDPAGAAYSYGIDWEGGSFHYGVSQTGNTHSIAVLLGTMAYSRIKGICANCAGSDPAAYVAFQIGNSNFSTNAQFFSNTIERINAGISQYALMARYVGGTGNAWTDIYLQNGSSPGTAQTVTQACLYDSPTGSVASDNVFTRLNVEHCVTTGGGILWIAQGTYNQTYVGLHMEDVQINAYGSQFIYASNGDAHFISPFFLDLRTLSGTNGSSIALFRGNYGAHMSVSGMTKVKWTGSFGTQLLNPGVFFYEGETGANGTDDTITFSTSGNVSIEDDASGTPNSSHMILDPIINTTLNILTDWQGYTFDPVFPTTDGAQFTVTGTTFTLYGLHRAATITRPATLSAAQTITLADTWKPSGTGSTRTPQSGTAATVHTQSGTYANSTTIKDGAGTTLTTISTATGQNNANVFGTTAWAATP